MVSRSCTDQSSLRSQQPPRNCEKPSVLHSMLTTNSPSEHHTSPPHSPKMWILQLKLWPEDRFILESSTAWLTDSIICGAQSLLKVQSNSKYIWMAAYSVVQKVSFTPYRPFHSNFAYQQKSLGDGIEYWKQ